MVWFIVWVVATLAKAVKKSRHRILPPWVVSKPELEMPGPMPGPRIGMGMAHGRVRIALGLASNLVLQLPVSRR